MAGPNLNGTNLFGGFVDPMRRKDMQQRRKFMAMNQALSPGRKTDTTIPGFSGARSTDYGTPRGSGRPSIFTRFGNGY